MVDRARLRRLLEVLEHDVAPLTAAGVRRGNKLFGAAILRHDDLSLVVAETNNEVENPLWHGEIHAIKRFYEMPAERRPAPADCYFLCSHEPCSLSAWSYRSFSPNPITGTRSALKVSVAAAAHAPVAHRQLQEPESAAQHELETPRPRVEALLRATDDDRDGVTRLVS